MINGGFEQLSEKDLQNITLYQRFDEKNNLLQQWEKQVNGSWKDVTEREQLRQEIIKLEEYCERQQRDKT